MSKGSKTTPPASAKDESHHNGLTIGTDSFEEARHSFPRPRGLHKRVRSRSFNGKTTSNSKKTFLKRLESSKQRASKRRHNTRSQDQDHDITVRPMSMADIADVFHLGNSIFTAAELPNLFRTWDDFTVVQNFESSPEFCFVAIATIKDETTTPSATDLAEEKKEQDEAPEEELIGFLLGDSLTKRTCGTRGYIQWVAVHPHFRRRGIAKSLLAEYTKAAQAQGISLLLADTPADNHQAIQMFNGVGLSHRKDHVYLTCRLDKDLKRHHVDDEGEFDFSYTMKSQKIHIRAMEVEDLHQIYLMGEQVFTKEYSNIHNFWDEHTVMASYLSDPEFCVVATVKDENKEDQVVGFAFGTTIEKPRSAWIYGWLVWLGCDANYQGIGLATQLYKTMLELFALEKVNMIMIDTQANNKAALAFFRKQGFGQDEEHVYLSNSAS